MGGDQTREFSAIRQGVIDLAIGSSINWSPQVKQLNLFSLPFLTPDEKSLDALIKGPVGKDLFAVLEKAGCGGPWPTARTASASFPIPGIPSAPRRT